MLMKYYRRIKDLREDNDLTQAKIAEYLGIQRGAYSMYEIGSNIIPLHLLDKLSIKYNVSIDYLVGLTNEKNNSKTIKPMNFEEMSKRLRILRKKKKYTQTDLAEILNITQSHYAAYEKNRSPIPITKLITLSSLYKISIDYMMGKIQ